MMNASRAASSTHTTIPKDQSYAALSTLRLSSVSGLWATVGHRPWKHTTHVA